METVLVFSRIKKVTSRNNNPKETKRKSNKISIDKWRSKIALNPKINGFMNELILHFLVVLIPLFSNDLMTKNQPKTI